MAMMMMRGLRQLNLTDGQKTQIKGVLKANAPKTQDIAKEWIAAREALGDAITADGADQGAISAKAAAVAAIELRGALLRADVHKQVLALLTPEQRAKAKELRAEGKGRLKQMLGRGMRRGMGRGWRGPGGPGGPGGIGSWF
jgi:periplasmic protein CpxP/Spy